MPSDDPMPDVLHDAKLWLVGFIIKVVLLLTGVASMIIGLSNVKQLGINGQIVFYFGLVALIGGIALFVGKRAEEPNDDNSPIEPTGVCGGCR